MSSKQPVSWHRACQQNWRLSVEEKRQRLSALMVEIERGERELAFYTEQIDTAVSRGLDAFDRDRFLVKRAGNK